MKRRTFIQQAGLGTIALAGFSGFSFAGFEETFTEAMLTGKGNDQLVGTNIQMMKETQTAFEKMKNEAAKEGIIIQIVSAYRSYQRQNQIWERKYNQFTQEGLTPIDAIYKIIEYSTIPGTSRHHWGTDIDIIQQTVSPVENPLHEKHFHGNGKFCLLKEWLDKYSEDFGFYEVYTNNPARKGFKYEPWHFSYAPLSIPMLKAYKKLDFKNIIFHNNIKGNSNFTEEFISNYYNQNILDVNKALV